MYTMFIYINSVATIRDITENFQIGFGSFVDKRRVPYIRVEPERSVLCICQVNLHCKFFGIFLIIMHCCYNTTCINIAQLKTVTSPSCVCNS